MSQKSSREDGILYVFDFHSHSRPPIMPRLVHFLHSSSFFLTGSSYMKLYRRSLGQPKAHSLAAGTASCQVSSGFLSCHRLQLPLRSFQMTNIKRPTYHHLFVCIRVRRCDRGHPKELRATQHRSSIERSCRKAIRQVTHGSCTCYPVFSRFFAHYSILYLFLSISAILQLYYYSIFTPKT